MSRQERPKRGICLTGGFLSTKTLEELAESRFGRRVHSNTLLPSPLVPGVGTKHLGPSRVNVLNVYFITSPRNEVKLTSNFVRSFSTNDTFMKSLGIELSDEVKRLPYLYWLHKSPLKHCFIAGSSKCSTKQLSSLLTKILTVLETGLEK